MGKVDRFIVPGTFIVAIVAVLAMTVTWVPHPVPPLRLSVDMGPPGIVPHRVYGLRFTPRNPATHHVLTVLAPSQRRCVDVTITDTSLTFLQQVKACRLPSGTYGVDYTFPRVDDYVIFVEMHPRGSNDSVARISFPLDLCWLRRDDPQWHGTCRHSSARLRGQEVVRSHTLDGMSVVLGAPAHAVQAGQRVQVTFLFLRQGRGVTNLEPFAGEPGSAIAVSMNTLHFVRLQPVRGQVIDGKIKGGVVSFIARFDSPSIYRIVGTFRYHGRPVRTSFVIDVNPPPTPTRQDNS